MDTTSPIEILRKEHIIARNIIFILESLAKNLRKKESVSLLNAKELVETIQTAMESHHKKEMDTFPYLVENKKAQKKDILDALADEHSLGYEYLSNALKIIDHKNKDEKEKYELLPFHLKKYTSLLRTHIEKEEKVLFPLIKLSVKGKNQDILLEDFKKISKKYQDQKTSSLVSRAATSG